jgi:hypothetical protein
MCTNIDTRDMLGVSSVANNREVTFCTIGPHCFLPASLPARWGYGAADNTMHAMPVQ